MSEINKFIQLLRDISEIENLKMYRFMHLLTNSSMDGLIYTLLIKLSTSAYYVIDKIFDELWTNQTNFWREFKS